MKLKLALLLCCCTLSQAVFAAQISDNYNRIQPPAKKKSMIVKSSVYNQGLSVDKYFQMALEYKRMIAENPENYELYVPLIEAYMGTYDYDLAFEALSFLNKLRIDNKLSQSVVNKLSTLYNSKSEASQNPERRSLFFACMSMLSILIDEPTQAEKNLRYSLYNTENPQVILQTIKNVFDYTKNYENGVQLCDLYLSSNKVNINEILKLKLSYLLKSGNLPSALKLVENISLDGTDSDEIKYEVFNQLSAQNISDKEIIKLLFKNDSKDLEQCYYKLYEIVVNCSQDKAEVTKISNKIIALYPESCYSSLIKSEILLNNDSTNSETVYNEVKELLNSCSTKITNDQERYKYNKLMSAVSLQPLQEAMSLFSQGYVQQALEIIEQLDNSEDVFTLTLKARCLIELNRMQEALDILNKAMAIDPNDKSVNLQFAYFYFANEDYVVAEKFVQKALSIDSQYEFALALQNKLNKINAEKYVNQIISAFDAQNYKEAMRLIDEALEIDSNSALFNYYKGLAYISQNNYESAVYYLQRAITLDQTYILAYYFLGVAYDNMTEEQNALMYYEQFIQRVPADEYGESEKIEYAKARIQKLKVD